MRIVVFVLLLVLVPALASAQLRGTVTAGVSVNTIQPAARELTSRVKIRPAIGRVPSRGWGLAMALNWFDAEVTDLTDDAIATAELGSVTVRPLMLGIGYTRLFGRVGLSPSIVAGPALNTLTIHDDVRGMVEIEGTGFERRVGVVSAAIRPGVNITYALTSRLGVGAFAGYLFNRPQFRLRTDRGERRTQWNTDGIVLSGGLVLSVF